MHYKNDRNIKLVITRFVFSSLKCTKIRLRGSDAPPDPVVGHRWGYPRGGDTPSHSPPPRRFELGEFSGPLNSKSWRSGWGGGKLPTKTSPLRAFSISIRRIPRRKSNVPLPKQLFWICPGLNLISIVHLCSQLYTGPNVQLNLT